MRQDRDLRIVCAYVWLDPIRIGDPEHCRRDAQERADAAQQAARDIAPNLTIDSAVVEGGARHHLLAQSTQAHLLVVGSRGHGGFSGLLMGSVSTAVASYASCPVIVVRGADTPQPSTLPVVVGIDGSALSDTALEFALEMAATRRARLVAVHTWSDSVLERIAPFSTRRRSPTTNRRRWRTDWRSRISATRTSLRNLRSATTSTPEA